MKNENISNENLIEDLNDIIVKNYDASKGFKNASSNVKQQELKEMFLQCSTQRSKFAGELQQEVRSLGGEPKHETSTLSAMHRAWMDVKSAVSTDETEAILGACTTGEKAAVKEYDDLLDQQIPENIRKVVQMQRNVVNDTLQSIKILEEAA